MKKLLFILTMFTSLNVLAYPTTFLEMTSEAGDYIGQGQDYYFTEDDGTFSGSQAYWGNPTYENNSVRFSFMSEDNSNWWYLSFSTRELGIDIVEGTYEAVRFPFEPAGSAGMSISGNGRGSNQLIGTFTVLDIDFGLNGAIDSFAATFEQHSEGSTPALFGSLSYNSDAFNAPEPGSISLLLLGVIGIFTFLTKRTNA